MNLTRSRVSALAVGCLLGLLLTLLILDLTSSSDTATSRLQRGQKPFAPALTLNRLSGKGEVSIANLEGRTVLLSFWASWCAGCKEEAHELNAIAKKFASAGLTVVGVDVHDSVAAARAFAKREAIDYELVRDSGDRAAANFGVAGLPTTFVISPEGRVVKVFIGIAEPGVLTDEAHALLG
jgi:cytochrome c biogenesis protein CcmG/thiol:disulfide interchange protein DsbE